MPNRIETIRFLEELSANAWPAEQSHCLGGWWLRSTHGYSRRANSVWPNAWWGPTGLEERLSYVESFYRERNQPSLFQLCDASRPAALDNILAARGYAAEGRTCVQVTSLPHALTQLRDARHAAQVRPAACPAWLSVYAPRFQEEDATVQACVRIFSRITPATVFVTLHLDGTPAASGLGVVERGWLGIYCMATLPEFRRRGAARSVLAALLEWGERQGVENAYLQVLEENAPARTLYESLGFATLYHYHYRRQGK